MKNVRNTSNISRISTTDKTSKKVKRLQPITGKTLWDKLEPKLPLPRKRNTKFKSPYKPPASILHHREEERRSNDQSSNTSYRSSASEDDHDEGSGYPSQEINVVNGDTSKAPPIHSTVKIQPIDPYKFCEPLLKVKAQKSRAEVHKKTSKAQRKVHREVLEIIQKTAATIKIIRKQHEEWKLRHQSMSFLANMEVEHLSHRKSKKQH